MNRKFTLALLLAVAVVTLTSCKKNEDSEFDKGKAAGKAACDCLLNLPETATELQALPCMAKLDLNKLYANNEDYIAGVAVGGKACSEYLMESGGFGIVE